MPKADFYSRLGLFVKRDFFDAETCRSIKSEMNISSWRPAYTIARDVGISDENYRQTKMKMISKKTAIFVKDSLLSIKSSIEEHFGITLLDCQSPKFLFYDRGDFFKPHIDSASGPNLPKYVIDRKVSAIVFLNDESDQPAKDSFVGGTLRFYGLISDDRFRDKALHLIGETGMLLAFRSDVLHEVTPVQYGERYTIVSWYV